MSQPEIFRRCAHCGASSKPGELFCAQCGNALVTEKNDQAAEPNSLAAVNDLPVETVLVSNVETEPHTPTSVHTSGPAPVESVDPVSTTPNTVTVFPPPRRAETASQQAVLTTSGGLEDKAKPRAEKPRRVSSVVLDEAAYDPSIRFILVVAFLFVVFLVLLLLSKWIV
jgi:hypothetical protein